jgi:hypothetical protein
MAQKKQPVSFRKSIAANTSGYIDYDLPDNGTVENVVAYFAPGQTFDLKVWLVIIQKGSGVPTDIILAADNTDKWLYGDNIALSFSCSRPVDKNDIIRVIYQNIDLANAMNLSVDVTIDYYAGKARVV